MKLIFAWTISMGYISVECSSDVVYGDAYSPLAYILNDSGGERPLDTLPWLERGLELLRSVKISRVEVAEWGREAWSAEITKSQVKIYSLHNESTFEKVSLDTFERALSAWIGFIQTPQVPGFCEEVVV
ncbi:hypothetical protein [Pseudomonas sp. NPDC087614]|uniref:hypothetical protein n=1 Tax=Pseudomonas sp. NPDC087614 TaxID=3364442 RepID=UPI003820AD73